MNPNKLNILVNTLTLKLIIMYIYVIHFLCYPGIFKVGSTKDLNERKKKFITPHIDEPEYKYSYKILDIYNSSDLLNLETNIHHLLKDYRITNKREFFKIDLELLHTIIITYLDQKNQSYEIMTGDVKINYHHNSDKSKQPEIYDLTQPDIILKDYIKTKLDTHDCELVQDVVDNIINWGRAANLSDPGIGKTYHTAAVCAQLGLQPFIVCPLNVVSKWIKVLKLFGVSYYGISNYESIKNGKYYINSIKANDKIKCPYITKLTQKDNKNLFKWNLPSDAILIFDEAHKCKNIKSQNSKLLVSASLDHSIKILLLSATLFDKISFFEPFGYTFKLYDTELKAMDYMQKLKCKNNSMEYIHNLLFDNYASRIRIKDLCNVFKKMKLMLYLMKWKQSMK